MGKKRSGAKKQRKSLYPTDEERRIFKACLKFPRYRREVIERVLGNPSNDHWAIPLLDLALQAADDDRRDELVAVVKPLVTADRLRPFAMPTRSETRTPKKQQSAQRDRYDLPARKRRSPSRHPRKKRPKLGISEWNRPTNASSETQGRVTQSAPESEAAPPKVCEICGLERASKFFPRPRSQICSDCEKFFPTSIRAFGGGLPS